MNTKRYWLRGGIILTFFHILVFAILVYSFHLKQMNVPAQYEPWPAVMIMVIPDFPVFVFLDNPFFAKLADHNETLTNFFIFFFGTLQWFIIGAFFGWIYGKIKNRKSVATIE